MKRNWVKPISCALALALTVGSFPGSVLAATSAQQAFEMTVQSVMEAANVTTDVVKANNDASSTDASTEKVTYQVTAGVAYGKGTIKIISGATEATNEDGEKYYAADKDSVITIEVAPESGWKLDSVVYLNAAWAQPTVTLTPVEGKDNQYTVTIPDDAPAYGTTGSFGMYANFSPILEEGQVEVKCTGEHLSVDKYAAKPGELVTITSKSESKTRHYDPKLTDEDGNTVTAELKSVDIDEEGDGSVTKVYTFMMPEKKVTIDESTNRKCDITLETNDDEKFAGHVTYSKNPNMSSNMTVKADTVIDGKYYKHSVVVTGTLGNKTVKNGTLTGITDGKANYTVSGTFPVAATLKVVFTETTAYNVTNTSVDIEGATFKVSNGELAAEGDTVTLNLTTKSAEGYYWDGTTLPKVTDAQGNDVIVTADASNTTSSAKFTFTMPAANVSVSLDKAGITQKPLESVTVDNDAKEYISLGDVTQAREGQSVAFTLTDTANKVQFIKVTSDDGTVYINTVDKSFVMPKGAATVSVVAPANWFEEGHYDADLYNSTASTYVVSDAQDLAAIGKLMNDNPEVLADKTVNIVKDIDMSAYTWIPVNYDNFNKNLTINGNGHKITGLNAEGRVRYSASSSWNYYGAFIGKVGSFTDLTIKDITFEGDLKVHCAKGNFNYVGAVCGYGGNTSIFNNVTSKINIEVDGMDTVQAMIYGLSNQPDEIVNCAIDNTVTYKNLKASSANTYYGLTDEAVNSYDISSITYGDNVSAAEGKTIIYGADGTLLVKNSKLANTYSAHTITNLPEGAEVYGIARNVNKYEGDTDNLQQNFSYNTPLTKEGCEHDNLMEVDANNKVGRFTLLSCLNSWVEENQTEDNQYLTWETDKTTGKPVLKAAKEEVRTEKYAITSKVTGEKYGETTVNEEANSDSKVTVYTAPKQFCKIKSITVKTADGKEVEVTDNKDGSYSFTMPKSAVTVETEYAESAYEITTSKTGEGTVEAVGSETKSSEKANEGETVTVTVTPDRLKYYTMGNATVTTASGKEVPVTPVEAINGNNEHKFTFTMPDEAVNISADMKDVSSYYNEDGTLKEGTYQMQAIFGSTYDIESDKITGAMGYDEQYTDVTVSVDSEGHVTVDDYEMPGVMSPIGYAGGGELHVKATATTDSNNNGIIKGSDDAGVVDASDYADKYENFSKVYTITPTVTKTGKINPSTNVKTEHTGDFYFTKVMSGSRQAGGFYNSENVESVTIDKLTQSITNQVSPFDFTFSGIDYIKNDDNYANQNVLFTTYITNMAYISEVLFRMDFSTIRKLEDTNKETETDLKVELYSACEPGGTKTPPATIDAIKKATLVTKADGSRQIVFDLGETVVFGLHGHMASLRVYNSDSMQSAFKEISKSDKTNLKAATYSDWYTDKINTEADMVPYDKTPVEVTTDANGFSYFTADGTPLKEGATTTDLENALIYPGKAVIDVPSYFDLDTNNEIYLTAYIDGMSKDTNLKLKLTDASKKETVVKKGTAHIEQFGEYDIDVEVTVENDIITDVKVTGANFSGTHAATNKAMLQTAIDGLKGSYIGKSAKSAEEIAGVDVVTSATYSSNAIRDAILNALELKLPEEEINLPAEKLAEGEYSVDIAFYTDKVKHSLIENDKATAKIIVDKDGNMTLDTDIINGTDKEPLYIYKFNGYYEGNDTTKSLKDAAVTMGDIDYTDDIFGADEQVVTHVSFPLEGDFAKIYNANASIYVPAMKNLNGNVSGMDFVNGRFSADCFVKVYWDSLKKSGESEADKFEFGSAKTKLTAGKYTLPTSMKNALNPTQNSMAAACISSAALTVSADGTAKVTIDLQPVSFAGLTAYASDWKIYQGTDTKSETVAAEYVTNSEGKVTQIIFALPDNSYDGVYVNMFVDAMNYSPDAWLAFDFANAVKIADADPDPTPDPTPQAVTLGDVDLNGKVELNDAVTVLKAALGIVTLEGDAATAADVDKDGNINLTDALNVLKFALGIIKEFPQK